MLGRKNDAGKPSMDLIPPLALESEARVMGFGAKKYGATNWMGGMAWSRLVAAAMRHLTSWHSGESVDPETGESHLAHLRCCAAMLMAYEAYGLGEDDRFGTKLLSAVQRVKDGKDAQQNAEVKQVEQVVVVGSEDVKPV
jgi:hypothetical protein